MVAGLSPALNDARMRFAFPSGISSIPLVLLRNAADGSSGDAPVAAARAFLEAPLTAEIDLDGNGIEQPLKLHVIKVLERRREFAWKRDPRGGRRTGR